MKTLYYINRISHEKGVTEVSYHVVSKLREGDNIVCQATYDGDGADYANYNDAKFYLGRKGDAIVKGCSPI